MTSRATTFFRERIGLLGVTLGLVVILPMLNVMPSDSVLHLSDFYLNLFGKYLSFAILALGLGLLWGFTGILSLGQAVFFGLGAYVMGMYLTLGIGAEGSKYGEAIPDFMVWNQLTELPLFWKPFDHFLTTVIGVILVPVLFAIVFGFMTFRSRIRGVYIAILTQALAYAAWLMFNRNEMNLGGTNGLTDFKTLLGFSLHEASTQRGLYILTALTLILSYLFCHRIVSSKFGKVLLAIRDNENRLRFSGYSTTGFKVFVFAVAAALGGIGGALYVPQVGIITPSQIGVLPSLEIVVWVAIGGRGRLIGAPIGAIVVNGLRTVLTSEYPELWPFILGGFFVLGVLLFPAGLIGLPAQLKRFIHSRRPGSVFSSESGRIQVTEPDFQKPIGKSDPFERSIQSPEAPSTLPETEKKDGETILYLEGVTVSFEGFHALENLNFYMTKGELRFVIGPNGAGKTTLLDVVCGKVRPVHGRVLFGETEILKLREHQIANAGIGRKFQAPAVFPHHSPRDNLALALKSERGVFPTLFSKHVRKDRERIDYILELAGLIEQSGRMAGSLSHGQKQWLEISMLIAQDPRLLLLDEPVAGMSGREREQTGRLLERIAREHSVLVIEHDMEFVRHLARTVTVMHEGSVLCEGSMDQVQQDPRVIEVYLGRG